MRISHHGQLLNFNIIIEIRSFFFIYPFYTEIHCDNKYHSCYVQKSPSLEPLAFCIYCCELVFTLSVLIMDS